MNLDFSAEQHAARDELRRLLRDRAGLRSARAALEGRAALDRDLWLELGQLGWLGAALPVAYGGQDLGHEMLCCIAGEIGRSMAAVPFGSSVALAAEALRLGGSEVQRRAWLPRLASGRAIGALAIAERAGALRPGAIEARFAAGRIDGTKVAVSDGMTADVLIVVAREGDDPGLYLVDATATGVRRVAQQGVDPSHAPATVHLRAADAEPLSGLPGWSGVQRLLDRAAVVLAFEQLGAADAALQLAAEYARTRRAFGREIGSFQAIKHKLADVFIANELARGNAYFAAWALQADAPVLPQAAAAARVSATEALERAARELIQVHGGIGVTWAHDAHLYYRRAQHLGLALGGLPEWQDRLVSQLAAEA